MDDEQLEKLDAYVQVAALGAYAEGRLDEEERAVLRRCVTERTRDRDTARLMVAFIDRIPPQHRPLSRSERERRVDQVRTVLVERREREFAFVLAVDVANASRGIGVRESSVLQQLMFDLDIEGAFARRIIEETSRCARGVVLPRAILRDAPQTLRSVGEGEVVRNEIPTTLRSPSDAPRVDEARQAATLRLNPSWEESESESNVFSLQPESPRA